MAKHLIKISEFSDTPYGRYRSDGDYCGEIFRDDHLKPALEEALKKGCPLEIDIDDVEGYGSSFLEEVFGGLIREGILPKSMKTIKNRVEISFREPYFSFYEDLIWKYIDDEINRMQ